MKLALGLAALLALAAPALAQAPAAGVILKGASGQSVILSAADIAAMPHVRVTYATHDNSHVFEGVPLWSILTKVGAPFGTDLHGSEMTNVVLISAGDGYQSAIALAEADPGTGPGQVILADRMDGAALAPRNGPYQLVLEKDLRPARSVRMVTAIEVKRLSTDFSGPGRQALKGAWRLNDNSRA